MNCARCRLEDVKTRMEVKRIHCGMDNQAREAHHMSIQDIKDIQTVSNIFQYSVSVLSSLFYLALVSVLRITGATK